jgi:hypothetical protein
LPLRDLIAQIQISTNRWNCCWWRNVKVNVKLTL